MLGLVNARFMEHPSQIETKVSWGAMRQGVWR